MERIVFYLCLNAERIVYAVIASLLSIAVARSEEPKYVVTNKTVPPSYKRWDPPEFKVANKVTTPLPRIKSTDGSWYETRADGSLWKVDVAPEMRTKDCGCAYSHVPNGLRGSPCTCNPTGKTPCLCGDLDQRPDVPIERNITISVPGVTRVVRPFRDTDTQNTPSGYSTIPITTATTVAEPSRRYQATIPTGPIRTLAPAGMSGNMGGVRGGSVCST